MDVNQCLLSASFKLNKLNLFKLNKCVATAVNKVADKITAFYGFYM